MVSTTPSTLAAPAEGVRACGATALLADLAPLTRAVAPAGASLV